jgi:ABC-type nitrate/sulfonate/bicarbonate transport system substrate-binding protein
MIKVIMAAAILAFGYPTNVFPQPKLVNSYTGTSSSQLAIWAAKDLNLFAKHGLDVDLVFIPSGALAMQALLGGNTHSASTDGVAPIHAILRGGDAVIVAGLKNKLKVNFVAQNEIIEPSQLRNKKIGIANFGGSTEFAVMLALKEWNIPRDAVTLVAAGGSSVRMVAMQKKGLDATVIPDDLTGKANELGIRVLADLSQLVPSFPDNIITMRRSYVRKERNAVKKYVQAVSEAIYQVTTNPKNAMTILERRLKITDQKILADNYNTHGRDFDFPPRVAPKGLGSVLEQIQLQTGRPKSDFELGKFLDESIVDELEREGFFKTLAK